jgi:hypothetical protein
MGKTYEIPMFFDDGITIIPHSATDPKYLGKKVSVNQFAKGRPVKLMICDQDQEVVMQCGKYPHIDFIEGPEA